MPSPPTDTQPQSWDRFFASQCNNRAWDLASRPRSAEESIEMLNAAHASAWHWSSAGTELNEMRAKMLLARVHTLLGFHSTALTFAAEVRAYFVGRETPAWELAFAHAIYAHAAHITGNQAEHQLAYTDALAAADMISKEQERRLFQETFELIPAP